VVAELLGAGVPVRALTREPATAGLPATVDVVAGDLTAPDSLDAALQGVGGIFLVWTAPPDTAPAVIERLASRARRVVFLSAPHQTPHPFFQHPNPLARFYAELEGSIMAAGSNGRSSGPGSSRPTPDPGGGRRSVKATSCGGLTARPRRHRSTSETSLPWRRSPSLRTGTRAATASSPAPSR
jgi:hypothetical protein